MSTESKVHEWTVPAENDGERLDRFLAGRLRERSRSKLQGFVKEGLIKVGGEPRIKSGTTLLAGESVTAELPPRQPVASKFDVERSLSILFEDDDVLVVDKPAGLLSHGLEGGGEVSLASLAETYCGPLPSPQGADRPGIVHRLDRETSGVMVLGKNEASLQELMRQFREREVTKTYGVLVAGDPRFQSDWIDRPLGRQPRHPERMSVMAEENGGRKASTLYDVQERFGNFTYLHCMPKTGRTHQIRVHLTTIELEVLGDKVYRSKGKRLARLPDDAPRSHRQMLHAMRLEFTHPTSGESVQYEAAYPADFAELLEWLRAQD